MEAENTSNEYEIRKAKLAELRREQVAYKEKFEPTHTLEQIMNLPDGEKVRACGRITGRRGFGKLMFCDLYDAYGHIQIEMTLNNLGEEQFAFIKKYMDIGDFVGVEGEMFHTKVGELTIRVNKFELLTKALRPLPEKYHGVVDDDIRFRQRYLDVIANDKARETLKTRFKFFKLLRTFMEEHGFIEVETPILQSVASGAAAKPFITHHNALNKEMYLRIAPELALKEIVAAGFNKVFEICKNFRNEGMDPSHLQEFTNIEWYAAYWNFEDNIKFVTELFKYLIKEIKGSLKFEYQGVELDFNNITRLDYVAEMNKILGKNILDYTELDKLKKDVKAAKIMNGDEIDAAKSIPALIDLMFKRTLREKMIQPVVVYNYPACLIPLARRNDKDNRIIDMFQFVVNGWELVKAYSELVDPETQRETFEEQMRNKNQGDEEAFELDEDFLLCMEHGMPPISGLGVGLERLIAMLTDQETLRDVIFFPIVK